MQELGNSFKDLENELHKMCPFPDREKGQGMYWVQMVNCHVDWLLQNCGELYPGQLDKLFKYIACIT